MDKILIKFADDRGRIRETVFETAAPQDLRKALVERGYYILSEEVLDKGLWERVKGLLPFLGGVSLTELADFTKLLRTLLRAGLPLRDALDVFLEEAAKGPLIQAIEQIRDDIDEGISFSKALARHPQIFPEIYVRTVVAGEKAGALEAILGRLVVYFQGTVAVRRKLAAALIYPSVLLLVSLVAITFMVVKVVPEFVDLFRSLEVPLPLFTQFVLGLSSLIGTWFWGIVAALAAGTYFLLQFARTPGGRLGLDRAKLWLPLLGSLEEKFAFSQFARTLATMLNGGLPLVESLAVVLDSLENKAIAARLEALPGMLGRGESFARSLKLLGDVPAVMVRVVHVGEESGNLGEMLENLADHYDEEISNLTSTLTSLVEPLLFLFMAVVLGAFIVALLMPVLTAATNIR
ncbi:MAG: Type IV fimbrial assembly protein PilC [Candidatus Ozemobacter sibiricus]|uniref:Type IV fimbrial assembly protein PilC n=1 Tax=Candidatus Ozemobacter sibiricus TaxID=2268124 RepID=A0A367ZRP8_9BACT|nr:MAG: Type IV fimbrial assembly protein PilC [Candidatus Ozemobacter sibiricus]